MGIRKEQSSKLSVFYLGSSESNADERINLPAIFPGCLYQLKLTKPGRPFGFCLEIEMTDERDTINHVLDEYVDLMKERFIKLESGNLLMSARVFSVDWSPVNFDSEQGVDENDKACFEHNLGSVFHAKAGTAKRLKLLSCVEMVCSEIPADYTLVVVKYHSAILDLGYADVRPLWKR
jgi:hypothetical protein